MILVDVEGERDRLTILRFLRAERGWGYLGVVYGWLLFGWRRVFLLEGG